jgi:hypothetical protein
MLSYRSNITSNLHDHKSNFTIKKTASYSQRNTAVRSFISHTVYDDLNMTSIVWFALQQYSFVLSEYEDQWGMESRKDWKHVYLKSSPFQLSSVRYKNEFTFSAPSDPNKKPKEACIYIIWDEWLPPYWCSSVTSEWQKPEASDT